MHTSRNDRALWLIILGVLFVLALILLPIIWKYQVQPALANEKAACPDRAPCVTCVGKGENKTCLDGMCNAQGNCTIPDTFGYPGIIPQGVRAVRA